MKLKTILLFAISMAVCLLAATYRFEDSAHVIGTIKKGGGTVRHPPRLDGEKSRSSLIVTARVIPPYRGNARVVLEGAAGYSYSIHNAEPVIRLPFHHRPAFRDNVYRDLRPNDKVAFWVVLKNEGKRKPIQTATVGDGQSDCCFEATEPAPLPAGNGGRPDIKSPVLAFYDTGSNQRLLTIPLRMSASGGESHGR